MSVPNAIHTINQEPSSGWSSWHHGMTGFQEVGLIGIPDELDGFEGYYNKLDPRITNPSDYTFAELRDVLAGVEPVEINRDAALRMRDRFDSTWPLRTVVRQWATVRFSEGALRRNDNGEVVGSFATNKDKPVTKQTLYTVRLSHMGRVSLGKRYATPLKATANRREIGRQYVLDRFLPVPIARVFYSDGNHETRLPIQDSYATVANHLSSLFKLLEAETAA